MGHDPTPWQISLNRRRSSWMFAPTEAVIGFNTLYERYRCCHMAMPDWYPNQGTVSVVPTSPGDAGTVCFRANGDEVCFGNVPAHTTIELELGPSTHTVRASSVGDGTVLQLRSGRGDRRVRVAGFREIVRDGPSPLDSDSGATLHAMSGQVDVTGVERLLASGHTVLSAINSIKFIESAGDLQVRSAVAGVSISVDGDLTIQGDASDCAIVVTGSVRTRAIHRSSVNGKSLAAEGTIEDSTISCARQVICQHARASTVEIRGSDEPVAFAATTAELRRILEGVASNSPTTSLKAMSGQLGSVTGGTIRSAGVGAIVAGELEIQSLIATQGHVAVAGGARGISSGAVLACNLFTGRFVLGFDSVEVGGLVIEEDLENCRVIKCSGDMTLRILRRSGEVSAASITASGIETSSVRCGSANLGGSDSESDITFERGTLTGAHAAGLRWTPPDSAHLLLRNGSIDRLAVDGIESGDHLEASLKFDEKQWLQELAVLRGTIAVEVMGQQQVIDSLQLDRCRVKCRQGSLRVKSLTSGPGSQLVLQTNTTVYASVAQSEGRLGVRFEGGGVLTLTDTQAETFELDASGLGTVELHGAVREIVGDPGSPPTLRLTANGEVRRLSGTWYVELLDGRARGVGAPVLLSMKGGSGQVVGVDPTRLPYADLDYVKTLFVFEPDSAALLRFAREVYRDQFAVAAASQHAHRIAQLVRPRAISGASRTAADWAASRLQHRATRGIEWTLRWLHRAVGYSQRPMPAFLAWLATAALVASADAMYRIGSAAIKFNASEVMGRFGHTLILPLGLLRFRLESPSTDLLFGGPTFHAIALVVVGLPFLFFVIALRHYLRGSGEDL